jgi:hypothetical protein
MDVDLDCAVAGEGFNATITPTLALDTSFLQAAADTLCEGGNALTSATVASAQVRVDAVAGADCNGGGLSVLSPVPQDVTLDVTVNGTCGAGGSVTVNSGISLPLPEVSFPCTATGDTGDEVAFCATGETPLKVEIVDPPIDTYVIVSASGIPVNFACGGPATTNPPPPGDQVKCTLPNDQGGNCATDVGEATFGETPFPTSDCDFPDEECLTVPIALDPLVDDNCATFTLEAGAADTPCEEFGGDAECQAAAATLCRVDICNNTTCDGSTAAACCDPVNAANTTDCSAENEGLPAECQDGVCTSLACTADADCDDENPCTETLSCDEPAGDPPGSGFCCASPPCAAAETPAPVADDIACMTATIPDGACLAGTCLENECQLNADCDDGEQCTDDTCDTVSIPNVCVGTPIADGTFCDTGAITDGACLAGTCLENECQLNTDCDDSEQCTDDTCDTVSIPNVCDYVADNNNTCTTCENTPACLCTAGSCVNDVCPPDPVDALGIPMACRNSFNNVVSVFPIDLKNVAPVGTTTGCILDGEAFNVALDPTIALDTAFLQAAADTLCATGLALTQADVGAGQIRIDAVAGATCTSQLSVLPGTPVTVFLDVTVVGTCGAGGTITVNSGISLPLPAVNMPCTGGTAGSEVQICSTGEVPLSILAADPPTDTFVSVVVGGGFISVAFQCNTSSTTNPGPGVEVGCNAPSPAGQCGAFVADVGATPLPVSQCDFAEAPDPPQDCGGGPGTCFGTCTTVPVGVDPATVCATFPVD